MPIRIRENDEDSQGLSQVGGHLNRAMLATD